MTSKKPSTFSFEQPLNPQEAIVNIKCLTIRNAATSEGFFRGQLEWTRKALVFFGKGAHSHPLFCAGTVLVFQHLNLPDVSALSFLMIFGLVGSL